jgi:hypothetical protein
MNQPAAAVSTPSTTALAAGGLTPADRQALATAVSLLEQPRFIIRLANQLGRPLDGMTKLLPKAGDSLHRAVHAAMLDCLTIAIESRDGENFAPSSWRPKALTAVTGGIGGFFGGLLLPLELPLTITLMLRAIADIAGDAGEDLRQVEARLACLQVFGMGDRKADAAGAIGYYAVRATLSRLTTDLVAAVAERTTLDSSAPVVGRLVAEVVGRFGFVLSERAAAGAVPVIGALGGASLNMMFMDHFERVARGHFTVRRLERKYGADVISRLYRQVVPKE